MDQRTRSLKVIGSRIWKTQVMFQKEEKTKITAFFLVYLITCNTYRNQRTQVYQQEYKTKPQADIHKSIKSNLSCSYSLALSLSFLSHSLLLSLSLHTSIHIHSLQFKSNCVHLDTRLLSILFNMSNIENPESQQMKLFH